LQHYFTMENKEGTSVDQDEDKGLEKLKLYLDFLKWLLGSFTLTAVVFFFNWGLKERNEGLNEIKEYSQHIELITKVEDIEKRRLLAQFFSNVTASKDLRKGWERYNDAVEKDYSRYLVVRDSVNKIKDSVERKTVEAEKEYLKNKSDSTANKLNDLNSKYQQVLRTQSDINNKYNKPIIPNDNSDQTQSYDPHFEKLDKLQPKVADLARKLIAMAKDRGIFVAVVEGYRSPEDQEKLYNSHQTMVRSGGAHTKGLAFDLMIYAPVGNSDGFIGPGSIHYFTILGDLAHSLGLSWGGDWPGVKDYPHFELKEK
jgi:D-alanyl-D-alanine carboxypeptidase-like protein